MRRREEIDGEKEGEGYTEGYGNMIEMRETKETRRVEKKMKLWFGQETVPCCQFG